MSDSLAELCERVLMAKANDAYNDDDLDALVNRALGLASAVERLSDDLENARLTIEALRSRNTELAALTHMAQYAEESS